MCVALIIAYIFGEEMFSFYNDSHHSFSFFSFPNLHVTPCNSQDAHLPGWLFQFRAQVPTLDFAALMSFLKRKMLPKREDPEL